MDDRHAESHDIDRLRIGVLLTSFASLRRRENFALGDLGCDSAFVIPHDVRAMDHAATSMTAPSKQPEPSGGSGLSQSESTQ